MKNKLLILLIFIVLASAAHGIEYYLDEEIIIDRDGSAYISGTTNMDILSGLKPTDDKIAGSTQELTNKKGPYWLFSYNSAYNVSNFIIQLVLPENVKINHIGSKSKVNIDTEDNHQVITFIGENKPLDIKVQYSFKESQKSGEFSGLLLIIILVLIILVAGVLILVIKNIKKTPKKKTKHELDEEKIKTIKLTLNDNQLKILEALIEKKGEASQTQLMYLTGIAKSSLSRNIELMTQKNVLSKFYSGTSNYIKIHPALYQE